MKGSLRRLKALIRKESFQIIRDISSLLIAVVLPSILMFIYGYGVSLDLNHLHIGVVIEDNSPDARDFAESLAASRYFHIQWSQDRRELYAAIVRGDIRGIVVIPATFSQYLHNPSMLSTVQVIADGSEPNTANFVHNYVQGALGNWLQQRQVSDRTPSIGLARLEGRIWYNEELQSRYFLLPGSLGIIMALTGTLLTALVVAREWERGTMEALMATPVHILELILGKLIPYFVLGMGSMLLCTFVATVIYGVPFRGSFLALITVSGAFLLASLGMGLFISTVSRNQFVASQAALVSAFMPALMLSGFIFEIASMPPIIQGISYLLPARYFVSSMKTLFLVGDVWSILLYDMVCILLIAAVFFALIALKTAKRLD